MNNPFNVLNKNTGTPYIEENPSSNLQERIQGLIGSSDIFLFMKGIPDAPQCGFSSNVVAILNHLKVEFNTFDILSDMDIRQGVKDFSNWPTYPQLYLKGKLVGGNDIITEMYESGDLKEALPAS